MADTEHDKLLAVLDPDPVRADEKYRLLRLKLLRYFEWNRGASPEDLAHEVILRALGRISEGQPVYAASPQSYFFGIARNVLREEWKRSGTETVGLTGDLALTLSSNDDMERMEQRLLLAQCLRCLPEQERALILRYFQEGPERARRDLGISATALRIRIHRIKNKIEEWAAARHLGPSDDL